MASNRHTRVQFSVCTNPVFTNQVLLPATIAVPERVDVGQPTDDKCSQAVVTPLSIKDSITTHAVIHIFLQIVQTSIILYNYVLSNNKCKLLRYITRNIHTVTMIREITLLFLFYDHRS